MVHFASIRHPATILDDLHGKVLNEAYQISKSTVADSVSTDRSTFVLLGQWSFKIPTLSCSQKYLITLPVFLFITSKNLQFSDI